MSRIRSVHPGFFTDEDIVSTSLAARLLVIGLGVEADDKGVFEWKPITIKMKIFPADNVDVASLLGELESANVVRKYEINGRNYGAIRNFRKFQRPKTPNDIHPMTDIIGNYVGLTKTISEIQAPKLTSFPPKGEKSPQMEDGGGRKEDILRETEQRAREKSSVAATLIDPNFSPMLTEEAQRKVDAWPEGMFDNQLFSFIAHAQANARTQSDWQAAFRTWIGRAEQKRKEQDGTNDRPSGQSRNRGGNKSGFAAACDDVIEHSTANAGGSL